MTASSNNSSPAEASVSAAPTINLALQGGGVHGAFAWGAIDRLLADGRLEIAAVSATSAGALNAVVLKCGLLSGGPVAARERLASLWHEIGRLGSAFNPGPLLWWERWLFGAHLDLAPSYRVARLMTHIWSPYEINPLNVNPLRSIVADHVDFERLSRTDELPKLFLSATNVRTGKIKIFDRSEISLDAVMASACLPQIFQAVEIDGEHYWDGGFMGNPAIYPLIYEGNCNDVLIVHINPLKRQDVPRSAEEITNRVNEISMNSSLMREMRAIAFVTRLIDEGALDPASYHRMRIHSIRADAELASLSAASKVHADWTFIQHLAEIGRQAAGDWLETSFEAVGKRSSVDIAQVFL
ncbi:MAG: patatin-like phospholipase family protein [Hyphomicrobiaceae bacterium]|nr:patatin-like phospholipase family protein [Hyphomicrobiaceae bacterium]